MKDFYKNDKSGNKKKYSFMRDNYPGITNEIIKWGESNGLLQLPFDELSYLKFNGLNKVPSDETGFKKFKSWSKGYNKNGSIKSIEDKFINNNLIDFKKGLTEDDYEMQKKGGYLTQLISNNYFLYNELMGMFDKEIPLRQKVDMFLNDITKVPKCKVCGNNVKVRLTHGGFRETCSEKCRRELEGSYKSYYIDVDGETIKVQGYERFVVPVLIEKYGRDDVLVGFEIKPIEYELNGELKKYYPDIYIKSENKIVEVKSTYTFDYDKEKNLAKREGCIKRGFGFEFYIWDKKGMKIK